MSANKGENDLHFLVVDDQAPMLTTIRGMLKAIGHKKVACAETGNKALAIIKRHPVDFIIADWYMPNMQGVELLRMIRQNPEYYDIPFIMITGEMSKEKIVYAAEEGVDSYLVKPISPDQVKTAVRDILGERSRPDSKQNKMKKLTRLRLRKEYDEALSLAHQMLEKDEDPGVLLILSQCYFDKKDYENAEKYIQEVLKTKKDSKSLQLLGNIYMAEGKYEEAIEYLKQSSELNPLNLGRRIQVGNAYLKLGLGDEATEVFGSLSDSEISDLNRVDIGSAYLSSGDVKKAGEYLEKTVDPIPETISVFNRYAMELRKIGAYEESISQYKKCLKIEPGHYAILYNLGRVYFEMKRYREAQEVLEGSLRSRPDYERVKKLLDYVKSKKT